MTETQYLKRLQIIQRNHFVKVPLQQLQCLYFKSYPIFPNYLSYLIWLSDYLILYRILLVRVRLELDCKYDRDHAQNQVVNLACIMHLLQITAAVILQ